ncbi:hypothetical protein PP940_gp052 [Rhizobium phage RL2RES]|uniref:Uncharacterized protein n=1 Tax=Rhizobium phage RL2RES TaxID=103371 RepID=A0A6B9J1S5_9CAUD|nr:hypothetical protein PP940_gp052 [Rhizobium phage RL2RES]QGZ14177.1 hypothetical protein RL2RES_052 [Rhizobium phage RL2RES]
MIERTILLGMNNPDPNDAFSTRKPGASGVRLLGFMNEYLAKTFVKEPIQIGGFDFERCFDRRNVLDSSQWDLQKASENRDNILKSVEGRRVIVLGGQTANALHLGIGENLVWFNRRGTTMWCKMPHPSGLNRIYNTEAARIAVGKILWEEMSRGVAWLCENVPPWEQFLTNVAPKKKFCYPPT